MNFIKIYWCNFVPLCLSGEKNASIPITIYRDEDLKTQNYLCRDFFKPNRLQLQISLYFNRRIKVLNQLFWK